MDDAMPRPTSMREGASSDVRELAQQTNTPIEEARAVYERELAALEADARVTMYVPVLAKRHARERLKGTH
jgi:hypothetical protein